MKLRNLMYATMIACAFASCSNDDVPTPDNGNPDAEGGTSLTVKFDKAADTKASGDITSLSMLVFNADGKLEVVGTKATTPAVEEGSDAVAHAELTAGVKEVALIANYIVPTTGEQSLIGKTKAEVFATLNKTFDSELEVEGTLTMNSKIYTGVVVAAEKNNVFGFATAPAGYVNVEGLTDTDLKSPVKLYRNVAKVVLNKISTKMAENSNKPRYSDPQLVLKEIFILQGHKKTNLIGENWGQYATTNVDDEWCSAYAHTDEWTEKDDLYTLVENPTVPENTPSWIKTTITGTVTTLNAYETANSFYVYENTDLDNRTLLVVKGDFSYKINDTDRKIESDRYYTIALGENFQVSAGESNVASELLALRGVTGNDGKYNGLYRNLQYDLTLTVTGPGYQTPGGGGDPTTLDVQCVVVPFGQVNQDVEI
ncbi:MAG TPA: fimbrial protein [Parabacteroides johnsonii]|uniref:fimbrial protein n=1 Tax=Parabacteroides johnsonii TaxID=387661 RepID=UPI001E03CE8B|nr:fimbrial protein [Parabacteroides johnsonii]HJG98060.1 fimbrial protein [Parabacteroides johnsonii]